MAIVEVFPLPEFEDTPMINFDPNMARIPKWALILMAGLTAITILLNIMPFAHHIFLSELSDSVYASRQNQQFAGEPIPINEYVARQSH